MNRRITPQTNLVNLKNEAKRWLKELRAHDTRARERFERSHLNAPAEPTLRDVQHAIAREFRLDGWADLKNAIERSGPERSVRYDQLAADMSTVYATGDADAMQRINDHYGRTSTVDDFRATVWRLMYKVRRAKGDAAAFGIQEARELISRTEGYHNWETLQEFVKAGKPPEVPAFRTDPEEQRMSLRRVVATDEWDEIFGEMKDHRVMSLQAEGFLTDAAMERIAEMDHVTRLDLSGCRQLSDDGLLMLARMPQLEQLDLHEYPGGKLTDRGLGVLRQLPNLRRFNMTWQSGISDAGVSNLKYCDKIELVNLMGSPTGDGAIEALRGKQHLRRLDAGRMVTDAGLAMLHEIPRFKMWDPSTVVEEGEDPTRLLIDGPFTNEGLAGLRGLDGVYSLNFFWHSTGITTDAFAVLRSLANLGAVWCDSELCDDTTMAHLAAVPRLRRLMAQGSAATDDGFVALSRSQTLEKFWGREAEGLTGRGFVAMSKMPSLRSLGISLKNVDDASLAALPNFPALRELTPIDVTDDGFRHVGRCIGLERLSCMYCRETTDRATEAIAGLRIKGYYAGLTQITDRSLEILGGMDTLESIELYETKLVTDAGLLHLVRLPRLKRIEVSGMPLVSLAGTKVFRPHVHVNYGV